MCYNFKIYEIKIFQFYFRPKYAIQAIKKKLLSPNPHTAFYALLVLESVVKNCGAPVHDEISLKENCETFSQIVETTPHENVKEKMLELIQAWAYAFRTLDKYQAIKVCYLIQLIPNHISINTILSFYFRIQ